MKELIKNLRENGKGKLANFILENYDAININLLQIRILNLIPDDGIYFLDDHGNIIVEKYSKNENREVALECKCFVNCEGLIQISKNSIKIDNNDKLDRKVGLFYSDDLYNYCGIELEKHSALYDKRLESDDLLCKNYSEDDRRNQLLNFAFAKAPGSRISGFLYSSLKGPSYSDLFNFPKKEVLRKRNESYLSYCDVSGKYYDEEKQDFVSFRGFEKCNPRDVRKLPLNMSTNHFKEILKKFKIISTTDMWFLEDNYQNGEASFVESYFKSDEIYEDDEDLRDFMECKRRECLGIKKYIYF